MRGLGRAGRQDTLRTAHPEPHLKPPDRAPVPFLAPPQGWARVVWSEGGQDRKGLGSERGTPAPAHLPCLPLPSPRQCPLPAQLRDRPFPRTSPVSPKPPCCPSPSQACAAASALGSSPWIPLPSVRQVPPVPWALVPSLVPNCVPTTYLPVSLPRGLGQVGGTSGLLHL